MTVLKVFASQAELTALTDGWTLVQSYPAFVVVRTTPRVAQRIARRLPAEDISGLYKLRLEGRLRDPANLRATSGAGTAPARKSRAASAGSSVTAAARARAAQAPDAPHHYVVQFVGPIKRGWLTRVGRAGGEPREPYGDLAYIVRADGAARDRIQALDTVRWVGRLPHGDRVSAALLADDGAHHAPRRRVLPGTIAVHAFHASHLPAIARAARALGLEVLSSDKHAATVVVGTRDAAPLSRKAVLDLAAVHGVRFIRQKVLPRPSNDVAAGIMRTTYARAAAPKGLGLSGDGEVIAVCDTGLDTGDAATVHRDFRGRVEAIQSYPITPYWSRWIDNPGGNDGAADLDSGHGTHVAGSVLGNGMASMRDAVRIQGSAPKARLVFQAVEQEMRWKPSAPPSYRNERYLLSGIPEDASVLLRDAYARGARIHSNSWGGGDPGAYDEQCRQFDDYVRRNPGLCVVIAAGNDGSDADGDGRINPGSVSSPGTAKNCITVGASENLRRNFDSETYGRWWPGDYPAAPYRDAPMADDPEQIVAFSSRGPTDDGRVKPEVVAPGTFILSTRSTRIADNNFAWGAYPANHGYFHMGGTSMATPLVSGAVALLREYLRKRKRIAAPSAALLKALLIAGARRLPTKTNALFDNDQGFGRVDLERSLGEVLAVIEGRKLATGELSTHRIEVPATRKTLRVVMAYTDAPGPELVNNLNLMVKDPAGLRYLGNASTQQALMTLDSRNNVELVQAAGQRGTWELSVSASNVREGTQDFALAVVLV